MLKIGTVLLLFVISSCFGDHRREEAVIFAVNEISKDQQIPKTLMTQIEDEFSTESKTTAPNYIFMPLQVLFTAVNDDVLKNSITQYNFQKGGGEVDYKDLVIGSGSFFLSFPEAQFDSNHELMHLYYISNSPKKNIDNEVFGLGCGKWIDLKKSFSKLQKNDFFKLNSNDLRYLSVSAGTYVFVFKQAKQIFLTQLTLTDSRFPKEQCLEPVNK